MFMSFQKIAQAIRNVVSAIPFNFVTLLLNTTATNLAQNNTFQDSSSNNFSITRNGTPTQGTFTPFSQTGWSVDFNNSGTYLTVADNASYRFGSANFTIEAWVYRAVSGAIQTIVSKGATTPTGWQFQISAADKLTFTDTNTTITGSASLANNTWYYVSAVRAGNAANQTTLYVNAVSNAVGTAATTFTQTNAMLIGADRGFSNLANGYISSLRLSNIARTISTVPTAPFTADGNTTFLSLNLNRLQYTNSASVYTAMTANGTPVVTAFSPFVPSNSYSTSNVGGSSYFAGTGNFLVPTANNLFNPGNTGAWTLETWIYPLSDNNFYAVGTNSPYANAIGCLYSGGAFTFFQQDGGATPVTITSPASYASNVWHHFAVAKNATSNLITMYVNAIRVGNQQYSAVISTGNAPVVNGLSDNNGIGNSGLSGHISNLRWVKGTMVYSGNSATSENFTVPTAPFTATMSANPFGGVNTAAATATFLLSSINAGIYDAAAKNDLQTVGNTAVSTVQAKFGTTSVLFNGSTDYLKGITNAVNAFDAGDFTVEMWLYPTAFATNKAIWGCATTAASATGFYIGANASGQLFLYSGGAFKIAASANSGTLSLNAWNYVAVVRSGSTIRFYVQGVAASSTWSLTTETFTDGALLIGASPSGTTEFYQGYMDEFRISKGIAKTISTPFAAFPTV